MRSEIMMIYSPIANLVLSKLQRQLQKDEKIANKITLELPTDLMSELDKALGNYFLVLKTFKELYALISTYKTVSSSGMVKQIEFEKFDC